MRESRFERKLADPVARLNASIGFDRRLFEEDIAGSIAWSEALVQRGLLTPEEGDRIRSGLEQIRREIAEGTFPFREELEDIHMNIEARLTELIGSAGQRLHTGRSRNDQVATDFRLYVKKEAMAVASEVSELGLAAVDLAEREFGVAIPAYTHLQRAQPVLFSHHILAYAEMLLRDRERFAWVASQADSCPLGSGACAGNQFGIDREFLRQRLGFARVCRNSLDAVSDRDFACDFLHAATLLLLHLSRWSEDLVLWSTAEFGLVRMDDSVSTGSSMLPQKRNPDACELVRAKTGRVLGDYVGLAMVLKALPLSYNKDLQEDKERVFDAADALRLALPAFRAVISTLRVDRRRAAELLRDGFLEALSLADYLVGRGVPFREAHRLAGAAVRRAEARGVRLPELSLEEYRALDPERASLFGEDLFERLSVEAALEEKSSVGGTAPARVREEMERLRLLFREGEEACGRAEGG